jgi:hypothetical protein
MSDKTVCVSIGELTRAQGWSVYRVRTSSSTYHVAIAPHQAHRFAVLRGYSMGAGRLIDVRDSDPQVGDESLFDIPPAAWSGKPLAFGTTVTSPVVEAAPETDASIVTVVTSALVPTSNPARPRDRDRVAYPEDWVEHAELAAEILRGVYRRTGLLDDIQRRPGLYERFNVALADCALQLRAIGGKLGTRGA